MTNGMVKVIPQEVKGVFVELDPAWTNGHTYCELYVNHERNHFMARLYGGETYSYGWGATGEDFLQFLIDVFRQDDGYLYLKIADLSKEKFIDNEKVADTLIKKMKRALAEGEIELNLAEEVKEELESLQANDDMTESHFYDYYYDTFGSNSNMDMTDVFGEEPWEEDWLVRQKDFNAIVFCEKVAPILADVLEKNKTLFQPTQQVVSSKQ